MLQPATPADHAALLDHWTTPQLRRFMFDWAVLTAGEISQAIADSQASFLTAGYGLWLISERDGGRFAGVTGLRPLEDLGLEVIWSLVTDVQGKGYATEAAGAVLEYGLGPLDCRRCSPRSTRATRRRRGWPGGSA